MQLKVEKKMEKKKMILEELNLEKLILNLKLDPQNQIQLIWMKMVN